VVLIIQQLAVFTNSVYIPNFNAGEIKIFKLNALSPEASHSARIVAVLMYSYICMVELKTGRSYNLMTDGWKNKYIWFVFLYLMLTMQSGFAIVMLFLIAFKTLATKNIFFYFPPLFLIGGLVFNNIEPYVFERVIRFGWALFTFDTATLIATDHSASVRLVPMIAYLQLFDISNINTWLGFGTDYTANLIPTLMPGVPEGEGLGGFLPGFFWDRGLICAGIALAMIYKFCIIKPFSLDTIFLLLLILIPSLNTQLFWISIMLFAANKYLRNMQKSLLNNHTQSSAYINTANKIHMFNCRSNN